MNFSKLHSGENHITRIAPGQRVQLGAQEDGFDVFILETRNNRTRLITQGESGPWHDEIHGLCSYPFGGRHYNYRNSQRHGFVVNGSDSEKLHSTAAKDESRICWCITADGTPLWTGTTGNTRNTYIGDTRQQHLYFDDASLTPDFTGFRYQAVMESPRTLYQYLWGGDIFFDGQMDRLRTPEDPARCSWMGRRNGSPRFHPYLDGKRLDLAVQEFLYDPLSFNVSRDHAHFLFGARDAEDGPLHLVVDGERLDLGDAGGKLRVETWVDESVFSPDGISHCVVLDSPDAMEQRIYKDGQGLGVFHLVHNPQYAREGLLFVARQQRATLRDPSQLRLDDRLLMSAPFLQPDTLTLNEEGTCWALLANEYSLEDDRNRWQFLLNGELRWSFDALAGTQPSYYKSDHSPIRFLDDGRVLCAGIKQGELMVYLAEA